MKSVFKFIIMAFLLMSWQGNAQEEHHEEHEGGEHFHRHSIALLLNHTIIGTGISEGENKTITVPSWALNYDYHFTARFAIGLHNDIITESFIVENEAEDEETLEREVPIASVIVGSYRISEGLALELGAGMEFEKNENFGLVRIGAEYAIPIPKSKLEVVFGADYDILFDGYDAFNIGIGLAAVF